MREAPKAPTRGARASWRPSGGPNPGRLGVTAWEPRSGKLSGLHRAGRLIYATTPCSSAFAGAPTDSTSASSNPAGSPARSVRSTSPASARSECRARTDEKLLAGLHDMHAADIAGHERFATTVETRIAERRVALADVAGKVAAARERVAAIERGEAVAGGLAAGHLDIVAVLRADGWTDDDIQHCLDLVEVDAIARRLGGADQTLADKVDRAITESSVAAGQAAQRKLVRRLLVELRALEPEPGDQV
jgi:hypothetical protein